MSSSSSLRVPDPSQGPLTSTATSTPRVALPTFAPLSNGRSPSRDDGKPESSTSGSFRSHSLGRRSQSRDRSSSPPGQRRNRESSSAENRPRQEDISKALPPSKSHAVQEKQHADHGSIGRSSKRRSGGFLLGSIGRSSRVARILQQNSVDDTKKDRKGKSKSTDTSTTSQSADVEHASYLLHQTPVARLRNSESRPSSSIGTSPLSTEVVVDDEFGHGNGNGNRVPSPSYSSGRLQPPASVARSSSLDVPPQKIEIRKRPAPTVGFDTDPAQIVSMALTLSEARRRQASERRYVSAGQGGKSRIVSTATTGTARSREQQAGSVAHYIQAQRTPSTKSYVATSNVDSERLPTSPMLDADTAGTADDEAMDVDELDQEVSAATKARVEKAKTFFELAYEHRRLLSHLPPVRRPGTNPYPTDPDRQGKVYNPLQYIRNRKLRIWDKTAIDTEVDGWHDVEKVRSWVDAVIESHTEARHDADECVRLPPLREEQSSETSRDTSAIGVKDKQGGRHNRQDSTVKPRRPRSDWITHPADILADCFWLEQGVNKIKILDRDNNNIYPPNTQFKFSGWRNRTPVHVPEGLHQPPPLDASDDEEDVRHEPLHPVSELPTFKSAHHHGALQRRKRSKIKQSLAVADEDGLSKGLKVLMDDSDSSDLEHSSGSVSPGARRGRRRLRKRQRQEDMMEVSPGQMPPPPPTRQLHDTTASDQSAPSSKPGSKRTSVDQGSTRVGRFLKRESTSKGTTPLSTSLTRGNHQRKESLNKFPGLDERPRNSAEYDTTAPNSPAHTHWPSIAINLESPAPSRSSSPSKRHSHVAAILKPLHRHHNHESISTMDFGDASKRSSSAAALKEDEKAKRDSTDASRGTSPMTRGQSPGTKRDAHLPAAAAPIVDQQGISRMSTKSSVPSNDHGRIRGIFKGGRIAELVGHEVSKVGDFIWKKDPPAPYRRRTSEDSVRSGYESDSETEPMAGNLLKTPPGQMRRSRSSTLSSTKSDSPILSTKSPGGSGGRPKYNNPNLPSFTSPFDRDREAQEKKSTLLTPAPADADHISRQAAEHRSNSRSPRLDRLAPPRLDTGSRSSSPNRLTPAPSNDAGLGLSLTRSQDATTKLNTALRADKSQSGIGQRHASGLDLSRISTHDLDNESPYVTWRDIQRALAFIYSSTVKAREIGRQADLPRKHLPEYMSEAMAGFQKPDASTRADLAMISRREEKVVAARRIMETLTSEASSFDEKLKQFSGKTAPALHRMLQDLEDQVDNKMTPRVRQSADEAGELSMRFATTSTLAIKGVNEAIDAAMVRRARGPVRWVRGAWYKSVELAVVGLLWAIWAVVSVVRGVLLVAKGCERGLRWLLWS